ncbi:hypothetical protein CsSME_00000987 [Camellia sinensis var. sinensis]
MADNIPHDRGSLGIVGDPEHVPLPPRVRPFDLETYHPEVNVLPLNNIWDSQSVRGYGAISVREWYMDLPIGVRQIIDEVRLFCKELLRLIASRPLLGALVKRWWDNTKYFHFSTVGGMMMTQYDFAMLTGIELWVYAYFPTLAPESEVDMPPVVPYSHRYDGRCTRNVMAALGSDA